MVAAGVGVTLLPQLAVQVGALLDDMVAYRRIGDGTLSRDVALFHRPGFSRIRDVRLLRQAIREILSEQSAVKVAATLA
jgi:LysR family hydrogen peroxide-inducible transcriptional activator